MYSVVDTAHSQLSNDLRSSEDLTCTTVDDPIHISAESSVNNQSILEPRVLIDRDYNHSYSFFDWFNVFDSKHYF